MLAGATEHKSVLETCRSLAAEGSALEIIPVHRDGTLDLAALEGMLASGGRGGNGGGGC